MPIHAYTTIGQFLFCKEIFWSFREILHCTITHWNHFQSTLLGFFALHCIDIQYCRMIPPLNQDSVAYMSTADKVIHRWVLIGIAENHNGIQVSGFHEGIEV